MTVHLLKKIVILLIIVTFPIYILVTPVCAFGPSPGNIYEGIDVSGWQGNIDYSQVANSGIQVVYMKTSEGINFVDPYFEQNYQNAKANGLKVGFYHYLTARSNDEAVAQANFFVSTISGKVPDCKLAMDFESFGSLSITQINDIGYTFVQTVQNLSGKEVVIYSDTYNASSVFGGALTNYSLWVAQYEVEEPTPNGNWENWSGWQYTDEGEIPGIDGYVDRDKYTDSIFLSNGSEPVPTPAPTPNPSPEPENTTTITVRWGDTLSELAIKYNTTVARLVELNNIANPDLIYAGATLIVPSSISGGSTSDEEIYIVKYGDTLSKIAIEYGTTVNAIASVNNIQNVNLIYVGQKLIIPVNRYETNHVIYKVKRGDTLWSLSRRYGVSIATIVRLNRIGNPNLIYIGQNLRI